MMTRKKKTGQSAPELPPGEYYGPYETSPYLHIKCTTCSRWLSTGEAIKKHIGLGCRMMNFSTGEPYDTVRPIQ